MTSDDGAFPVLPMNLLELGDVLRYLTALSREGHRVYRHPSQENVFYVELNESYRLRISASSGRSQIQLHYLENDVAFLDVASPRGLQEAIAKLAATVPGMKWPFRPNAGRLNAETPATNYRTISELVGAEVVEGVFDPYLTNGALEELRVILSFGTGAISDGVRLLGSTETTTGSVARFTKAGVDAWLRQMRVSGEARVVRAKSEHRRFLLISGGRALLLGPSLNSIHKNEAVRVELDTEDRPFFDATWATAAPVT
jgi:hypothetical protein